MMEVSEKCAQRPAHRLPGHRAPIPGMALDVPGDVLLADLAEVAGAGRAHLTQEPADDWQLLRVEFLDFRNAIVVEYSNPDTVIHVILDNLNTHKPKNDRAEVHHPPPFAPAQSLGNDLLTLMTDLPCIIR
jgi:hypothetical protein